MDAFLFVGLPVFKGILFEEGGRRGLAIAGTSSVLTENLKSIATGASAMAIPVRPTPNDMEPFVRTVSLVSKAVGLPHE